MHEGPRAAEGKDDEGKGGVTGTTGRSGSSNSSNGRRQKRREVVDDGGERVEGARGEKKRGGVKVVEQREEGRERGKKTREKEKERGGGETMVRGQRGA